MKFENDIPTDGMPASYYSSPEDWLDAQGDAILPDETPPEGIIDDALLPDDTTSAPEDERSDTLNEVELPTDIARLVEHGLIHQPLVSGSTSMFIVEGHPDLWVRLNEGYTLDERSTAKAAADRLGSHGVHVLPSTLVEQGEEIYVVTNFVDGMELGQILSGVKYNDDLAHAIDTTWAGLCDGLVASWQSGEPYPIDIRDTFQYMYGTRAGDQTPRLWLVDLPHSSFTLGEPADLERAVLDFANLVTHIEERTECRLPAAREAIERALEQFQTTEPHGDTFAVAVRHVLATGERLDADDIEEGIIDIARLQTGAERAAGPEGLSDDAEDEREIHERFPLANRLGIEPATLRRMIPLLDPANLPGQNTEKFFVRGRPDLLFRLDAEGIPAEDIAAGKMAADKLLAYGVNILPSDIVEYGNAPYIATNWVDGVNLEEALADNPTDELIGQVDELWTGLCNGLIACREGNGAFPKDLHHVDQYMLGIKAGDTEPKIWLTDLPCGATDINNPPYEAESFEYELMLFTSSLVGLEIQIGRRFEEARAAIARAIPLCRDSEYYGDGLARSVEHMLEHGVTIYPYDDDDEIINQLRTR